MSAQPRSNRENSTLTKYYESGVITFEASVVYGRPFGLVKVNYEDGRPMAEVEFEKLGRDDRWRPNFIIKQYWDTLGNKIVSDGNGTGYLCIKPLESYHVSAGTGTIASGLNVGTWKGCLDEGATYEDIFDNGKLVKGTQVRDGKTYEYTEEFVDPQPAGGIPGLMKFISQNLKYPKSARRRGTEGTVLIDFLVNTDGSVGDIKTLRGIGADCDAEGRRVVSLTKWKPGFQRGRAVRTHYVLPLRFVLH